MTTKPKTRVDLSLKNEGQPTPAQFGDTAGGGRLQFHIDLASLGAPERRFTADGVDIQKVPNGHRLVFSISKAFGKGPRAVIDIAMSTSAAQAFADGLENLARKEGETAEFATYDDEPSTALALSANFVRISSNDQASIFDFYYASPFSFQAAQRTQEIHMRDVVRIETSALVFFAVVKYFRANKGGV